MAIFNSYVSLPKGSCISWILSLKLFPHWFWFGTWNIRRKPCSIHWLVIMLRLKRYLLIWGLILFTHIQAHPIMSVQCWLYISWCTMISPYCRLYFLFVIIDVLLCSHSLSKPQAQNCSGPFLHHGTLLRFYHHDRETLFANIKHARLEAAGTGFLQCGMAGRIVAGEFFKVGWCEHCHIVYILYTTEEEYP